MGKIFEAQTEHVMPFKILIEVLKEILNDVIIEVIRDDAMNKATPKKKSLENNDDDDDDVDYDEIDDDDEQNEDSDSSSDCEEVNTTGKKLTKKAIELAKLKKAELKLKKAELKKNKEIKSSSNSKKESEDKDDSKSGGLKIMTVDNSKTLLVQMKLEAKQFSIFKCKPSNYDIGLSLVQLYKLLKSLEKDDTLTLCVEDDDEQYVVIKVDNQEKSCETTYKLKLMDLNKKEYKIPPTLFDAVITLDSTEFHKICREMVHIAEHVEIRVTPNSITYTCVGDCATRSSTYYPGENGIKIKFGNSKVNIVQGIFELKYLVLFTKCAHLCNNIQIYMKNSYPLCIKYTVATLGKILLCLAPIEDAHTKGNFSDDEELYDDEEVTLKKNC
jgi:proliferating cell nuclear antigen